ncbi:hypothetical protein CL1_0682 [Thermococcus cleftensis]|uniref:HEPN domain-containing protein n=1 Tax=Thermococcus cleftensis (strain DSM 27260 / KACC 17922 / CL1) TaxID=163003 RepID=I3ZT53_THECF|nr:MULTISPECIES: hypothetical protein [Thermococcus]AFL94887.1 hypothetical protein CL1_0682 [Thermococcus cleftensis]NJE03690.1 hypothetical protein [Thermococcus sp. MV11]
MERELLDKVWAYLERGNYYLSEGRFEMAHMALMDALYTLGAYLVYRDTGMLLPAGGLEGMLGSRYPEVYEVIRRYGGITDPDEETVTALREELKTLLGMMTLPSPEL